ncbi:MAG: hypothetical protein H0X62_17160 [Bacteroidetes bacterium]|nr:hypothetical protein [Bacteroidota bacterium]
MICLSGGKTTFSFLEKKACFPLEEDEKRTDYDTIDARCCDFVSGYVQVDLLSFENQLKIKDAQITAGFNFLTKIQARELNLFLPQITFETPPLLYGVSLLKYISLFRI